MSKYNLKDIKCCYKVLKLRKCFSKFLHLRVEPKKEIQTEY